MSQHEVAILLCSYEGERFLEKQLDSIVNQTYPHWKLYISDDGSKDQTIDIIKKYQTQWGRNLIQIFYGPQKGFVANFMSLVYNKEIQADFFAFSDQDDIWELNKLERAVSILLETNTKPSLYCSRTRLIDAFDRSIKLSIYFKRPPSFKNALMHNIASGNTMVFNKKTINILQKIPPYIEIALHDWWVYLLVMACGGSVFYDIYPSVLYRQHEKNLIGAQASWLKGFKKFFLLFKGYFAQIMDKHIYALSTVSSLLTPENKHILNQFCKARTQSFLPRLIGIRRSGVFCQTIPGKIKFIMAVLLKKI